MDILTNSDIFCIILLKFGFNTERNGFMKKYLSLALLLCMIFAVCSCAQQSETETAPEFSLDLGVTDLMGEDFLLMHNNAEHSSGEEYLGYVVDTEFADLALQRIREVENTYHVKITEQRATDLTNRIQAGTASGLVPIDAAQGSSGSLAGLLRTGYFADITQLQEYIDYTDSAKWGNTENLKPLFWNNGLYGVIPAAWPIHKYRSVDGAVVVNEDIIRRLNQTDPRELVERDEWTWRTFEELMPIYNHINDAGDEVKALSTTVHWLFRTMHTTNGEPVIIRQDGDYLLSLHSPVTFEAMQTAWNWTFGEYSTYVNIDLSNVWENMLAAFIEGRSVLTIMNGTDLCGSENSIAYSMDNFGVVPFPHGPNGTAQNTGATITDTRFSTCIPALAKDPAISAFVLNAIYEPLPGYEDEESMIDYFRRFYFFDDRDVTNFMNMYNTVLYNYREEGVTDVYIGIRDNRSMQESLDAYAVADETNRIKYIVNIESSIDEIFGE